MRSKHSWRFFVSTLVSVGLLTSLAFAWNTDAPIHVRVHHHTFERAVLSTDECVLNLELYFDAPAELYENRVAAMNYYRFHARLKFESGLQPRTIVFGNRGAGRRVFRTQIDSSSEGCWTKTKQKLFQVDVEGCRG